MIFFSLCFIYLLWSLCICSKYYDYVFLYILKISVFHIFYSDFYQLWYLWTYSSLLRIFMSIQMWWYAEMVAYQVKLFHLILILQKLCLKMKTFLAQKRQVLDNSFRVQPKILLMFFCCVANLKQGPVVCHHAL